MFVYCREAKKEAECLLGLATNLISRTFCYRNRFTHYCVLSQQGTGVGSQYQNTFARLLKVILPVKALANEDTLLQTHHADTNVSPFARARNICCGHKFCVRDTKNVSDFV